MSEVVYLHADRTSDALQSRPAPAHGIFGPRVYVREAHAGLWIVHDDSDTKGGCFRSHETAFRFAEEEFGADAQIVVQPQFSGPRKPVSHFKQSASVAQQALVSR